jgi:hypothetical protein
MALFDIKQIENSYNEPSSSYDWLWGVLLGFGLSFAQSEYQRHKDEIKVVDLFESELERVESDFEKQLDIIKKYIEDIKGHSKNVQLTVILNHKFSFIKNLDIQILSKHYRQKKYIFFGKSVKEKNYVSEIMTCLNVTEFQISDLYTLNKIYAENQLMVLNQYLAVMRDIGLKVTNRLDTERLINEGRISIYTKGINDLCAKYFEKDFNVSLAIRLLDTFHKEFSTMASTDPLHLELSILNTQAVGLIGQLKTLDNQHLGYVESLEEPIKEQYKRIYKKELLSQK